MDAVTTDDLHYLELTELAARIRAREVSPIAVTRAQLDRIAALDGELCSYALVMADVAMAQAKAAEAEIAAGRYRGPLHGVPIAVKDLCWTKGVPTAAGMAIYTELSSERRCDRGASPAGRRRGAAGQAAAYGRRILRSPPVRDAAQESMECRLLARHFVERPRRGDSGGPVLRLARLRYRRIDPLAVRRQRR